MYPLKRTEIVTIYIILTIIYNVVYGGLEKMTKFKTSVRYSTRKRFHCGTNTTPKHALGKWTSSLSKIRVRDNSFVDEQGRVMIFHGLNVVQKGPPWYSSWMLNDTKIRRIRQYGFNIIRLGTMWTGVMPQEGIVNTTYINILQAIVKKLGSNGIYVILDMHQDVLSSVFQSYDGAPRWLVDKLPRPRKPFPWPLNKVSTWSDGYLTDAVGKAFQGIYNDHAGARGYLAFFWQIIAKHFKDFDNVLGYELINEPWAGDIYSHPSLLLPGNAGRKNLQPLYRFLNKAIREYDNKTIIFYEPVTWGIFSNGTSTGSGFTEVPGGTLYENRSSLSFHYYCWLLGQNDAHRTYPWIKRELCDKHFAPIAFKTAIKDVIKTGGASFLTEFGLCGPDGNVNSTVTVECNAILQYADKYIQSWAYWGSDNFQKYFNFTWESVAPFVRTFARKISGYPHIMEFNINSKNFQCEFVQDSKKTNSNTEIFVPQMHYPKGFLLVKQKGISSHFDTKSNILYIDSSGFQGKLVKLFLKPI